jgi:hypothetical protein
VIELMLSATGEGRALGTTEIDRRDILAYDLDVARVTNPQPLPR